MVRSCAFTYVRINQFFESAAPRSFVKSALQNMMKVLHVPLQFGIVNMITFYQTHKRRE